MIVYNYCVPTHIYLGIFNNDKALVLVEAFSGVKVLEPSLTPLV